MGERQLYFHSSILLSEQHHQPCPIKPQQECGCNLPGVRCGAGNTSRIVVLDLHNLELSGTLPPETGMLSALQHLFLSSNKIEGDLPTELGRLSQLEDLSMAQNCFTGTIPAELVSLGKLKYLDLSFNKLVGSLPLEIYKLTALTTLNLEFNQLSGPLPNRFPPRLVYLSVGYNELTGSIPASIGQLEHLFDAELQNNYFTALPSTFADNLQLSSLSVGFNHIAGPLPDLPLSLLGFYAANNNFTGMIPVDYGKLQSLSALELDHNRLTGSLPADLGQLGRLEVLHVQNNMLSGQVPDLSKLANITSLLLQNNAFWGNINSGTESMVCRRFKASQPSRLCNFGSQHGKGFNCNSSPCVRQECHAC